MATHQLLPSEIEPTAMSELIEDARLVPHPQCPPATVRDALPLQRRDVKVPDRSVTDLAGYADYGC